MAFKILSPENNNFVHFKKIRNRSVRAPSSYPTGAAYIQMHLKRIRNTFQKLWEDLQRFFFEGLLHCFPILLRELKVAKKKRPVECVGCSHHLPRPTIQSISKHRNLSIANNGKRINVQRKNSTRNRINEYPAKKKSREIYKSTKNHYQTLCSNFEIGLAFTSSYQKNTS